MSKQNPGVAIPTLITRSPALWSLARNSGIGTAEALGHLVLLWTYAAEHAPDGDLGCMNDNDIENVAGWTGSPWCFYDAAVHAGFIEEGDDAIKLAGWQHTQRGIRVTVPQPRRAATTTPNAPEATPTPAAPLVAVVDGTGNEKAG